MSATDSIAFPRETDYTVTFDWLPLVAGCPSRTLTVEELT